MASAVWSFRPSGRVLERLHWRSDVLPGATGSDQMIAISQAARRSFEIPYVLEHRDARHAENLLAGRDAWSELIGLPIWMDAEPLLAPLSNGSNQIPADTTTRSYTQGGYVMLAELGDARRFEVLEIATVDAAYVETITQTVRDWPAGAVVLPLAPSRMGRSAAQLARFTGDSLYGTLTFTVDKPYAETPDAGVVTYRNLPVLTARTHWETDPEVAYAGDLNVIDSGLGRPAVFPLPGPPRPRRSHRWTATSRAECAALRAWLFAVRGRARPFWAVNPARDFVLVAPIGAADTTIDVEHCGYTDLIDGQQNRRDIAIRLPDGTTYYRRITGSIEVNTSVERLTLDAALGAAVASTQGVLISYLHLWRLDSDVIELAWWSQNALEVVLPLQGIANDL